MKFRIKDIPMQKNETEKEENEIIHRIKLHVMPMKDVKIGCN